MIDKICPECNGEGVIDQGTEDERRCPTCNGSGVVPDDGQGSEEVWNTHRDCYHGKSTKSGMTAPHARVTPAWFLASRGGGVQQAI